MGVNWNEKYNPESLNFLKNQPNIALPTIFSDALSYYEQISKIYHALLDIVEKVNNSVDLSHEAVNTANEALAGVDVARLKADSKVCLYKGATELSTDPTAIINLGVLTTDELKNYFVVENDAAEVVPTVCIDYRNGYAGIAAIDEDTDEVKITPIGFGLDITNVVKVIEQTFSAEEKAQARANIGAASQSDMSTAQGNISTLQEQYGTLNGEAVKYTAQSPSDAQKAQARANIGAANASDVSTLDGDAVKYVSQSKTDAERAQARANIDAPSVAYVDGKQHVPAVTSGDLGKVLTANGVNYAWETPLAISGTADVLVCNITASGSSYVCDKTYAQIAQAVLNSWPVVGVIEFTDGKKQVGVLCVETNAYKFDVVIGEKRYSATIASDNSVTVSVTDVSSVFPVTCTTDPWATTGTYSGVTWQEIRAAITAGKLIKAKFGYVDYIMTAIGTNLVAYTDAQVYEMTSTGWRIFYTGGIGVTLDNDPATVNSGTYSVLTSGDLAEAVETEGDITISWSGGSIKVTEFRYVSATSWTCKALELTHKRVITLSNNGNWTATNF